jgi:hypothetical protein
MMSSATRVSIDGTSAFSRRDNAALPAASGVRAARGVLFSVLLAVPFWAMVGLIFF